MWGHARWWYSRYQNARVKFISEYPTTGVTHVGYPERTGYWPDLWISRSTAHVPELKLRAPNPPQERARENREAPG